MTKDSMTRIALTVSTVPVGAAYRRHDDPDGASLPVDRAPGRRGRTSRTSRTRASRLERAYERLLAA